MKEWGPIAFDDTGQVYFVRAFAAQPSPSPYVQVDHHATLVAAKRITMSVPLKWAMTSSIRQSPDEAHSTRAARMTCMPSVSGTIFAC